MVRQHVCVRVKELFEGWGCTSRSSATMCVGGLALATVNRHARNWWNTICGQFLTVYALHLSLAWRV